MSHGLEYVQISLTWTSVFSSVKVLSTLSYDLLDINNNSYIKQDKTKQAKHKVHRCSVLYISTFMAVREKISSGVQILPVKSIQRDGGILLHAASKRAHADKTLKNSWELRTSLPKLFLGETQHPCICLSSSWHRFGIKPRDSEINICNMIVWIVQRHLLDSKTILLKTLQKATVVGIL